MNIKQNVVTIITPLYNRANLITKLYTSLTKQTCYDFEWMIIDDGSTDFPEEIIENFSTELFNIIYEKKENGGKHTALNIGIQKVKTPLTFIVDSDDWLDENAVEVIQKYYKKYQNEIDICGFSFLRKYPDGKINGKKFESNELKDSFLKVRIFGNDTNADKAEVFFTEILKKYPFPVFAGEKFIGEDIVWIKMSDNYLMVHINEAIYIGDYQEDGLTKNRRVHNINAPIGCFNRSKEYLKHKLPLMIKLKNILQLIVYGKIAHYNFIKIIRSVDSKLFIIIFYPIGYMIWKKWFYDLKKEKIL